MQWSVFGSRTGMSGFFVALFSVGGGVGDNGVVVDDWSGVSQSIKAWSLQLSNSLSASEMHLLIAL